MIINLEKKISLVTGAGRGLGESIAIQLSKAGSDIIAVSRNKNNLKDLKKKLKGKNNHFISCDLQKKNSAFKIINFLKKKNIRPDIVINNVGGNLGYTDPLISAEKFLEVLKL
jgi:3-oxoacyl-[acyl-carrier protein] reductase